MCTNPIKIITPEGEEVKVKCGKCDTCIKEKYQEWAIKLINESKYHKKACFITLTFDNKILLKGNKFGADPSFLYHIKNSAKYFTNFIKRLRKKYEDAPITYFATGEYGEVTKRTHWHAILYGIDFKEDRIEIQRSKSGKIQYHSKSLFDLWACGRISIQDLNPNNTIYISQYTVKKYKNNKENERYKPILRFSNRSKISEKWVNRNYEEIVKGYIEDQDGKKYRIPKSYIKRLKNSKKGVHKRAYEQYQENLIERMSNYSNSDIIKNEKIKEEKARIRSKQYNKKRDF